MIDYYIEGSKYGYPVESKHLFMLPRIVDPGNSRKPKMLTNEVK